MYDRPHPSCAKSETACSKQTMMFSGVQEHIHALTSLRFFAAFYVMGFHYEIYFFKEEARLLSLGYSGVTFFFVLSGFILSHAYHSVDLSMARHRAAYL